MPSKDLVYHPAPSSDAYSNLSSVWDVQFEERVGGL